MIHNLLCNRQGHRLKCVQHSRAGDKHWRIRSRRWNKCSGRSNFVNEVVKKILTQSRGGLNSRLWCIQNRVDHFKQHTRLITVQNNNIRKIFSFSLFYSGLVMTPAIPQYLKRHLQFVLFPLPFSSSTILSGSAGCFIQPVTPHCTTSLPC